MAARQVLQGRAFPALLERRLNQEEDDRYEVIPLGRGGIGQVEETKLLDDPGLRFAPRLVILLFVGNDLYNNDPEFNEQYERYVQTWQRTPPTPRGLLFPGLAVDRVLAETLVAVFARYAYLLDEPLRIETVRPDDLIYIDPTLPQVRRAQKTTEALLDGIVARCKALGADLLLVLQCTAPSPASLRQQYPGLRALQLDVQALTRWLQTYAESRGIFYLDLGPDMTAHLRAGGEPVTWRYDGHWNELGHELAAESIHHFLRAHEAAILHAPAAPGYPSGAWGSNTEHP